MLLTVQWRLSVRIACLAAAATAELCVAHLLQCGGKLQSSFSGSAVDVFSKTLRGLAATKLTKPSAFRTADGVGYAVRCSYKVSFTQPGDTQPTLPHAGPAQICCLQCAQLGWAVLYCAVLCCAVLCCLVLCCAVLCCIVLCCAVLCCAVLCCAVLCCTVLLTAYEDTTCTLPPSYS